MTKFKPLGNRVLIRRSKAIATKGGILLPESAQEKPKQGEIIAAGPGAEDKNGKIQPLSVKVGDKVLFSSYAGTEVKSNDDEELMILKEDEILGILT